MPEKIGRFELLERLSDDGISVSFRANDPMNLRIVVLKKFKGTPAQNEELRARVRREIQEARCFQHPNIISVYDTGEENGNPYFVMDLLQGDWLSELLDKENREVGAGPSIAGKLDYVLQLCHGLEYLHHREIVHRDIKPGNIWVSREGVAKLGGFQFARWPDHSSAPQTHVGVVIGSIGYMPPEQLRGEKADIQTDIWALGCTMYEMLTHTRPFRGDTPVAVMRSICSEEPTPVRELCPELPAEIGDILRRMLSKDPSKRYQNMNEVLTDLGPLVHRSNIRPATEGQTDGDH